MASDMNMSEQSTHLQASQLNNLSLDQGKTTMLDFSHEQLKNISYIKEHMDASKVDFRNEHILDEEDPMSPNHSKLLNMSNTGVY